MKKFILAMLCIFAALSPAWAQQRQIKGVVVDTEGNPLLVPQSWLREHPGQQ